MELRTLRIFQWVVQLESFSKAAAALGYTQAAVTTQIQQLEKELHTRLFDRFGKTTSLTQQGTISYDYACRIFDENEKAKFALQETQELEGYPYVGTTESLCTSSFPRLLHAFYTTYPYISISVETSPPEILLDMMNHNELDIVYFIDRRQYHPGQIRVVDELEKIVFVCHPSHTLTERKSPILGDLLQEELVLTESVVSYRYELDQYALSIKQQVHSCLETGDIELVIRKLLSEYEISFLPALCVQSCVDQGRLSILRPRDFQLRICRQIVYHKNKRLTSHTNVFLSFASQWIQIFKRSERFLCTCIQPLLRLVHKIL